MEKIIEEIKAERARQDKKWGGSEHDDTHELEDWPDMIQSYAVWAKQMVKFESVDKYRNRMVQIAAMSIAALESFDRKNG